MNRATEKQIKYIQKLIDTKKGTREFQELLDSSFTSEYNPSINDTEYFYNIGVDVASEMIDALLKLEDEEVRPISEKQYYFLVNKINKGKAKKSFEKLNVKYDVVFVNKISFEVASQLISDIMKK